MMVVVAFVVVHRADWQMVPLAHTTVLIRYDEDSERYSALQPLFDDAASTQTTIDVAQHFRRVTLHQHHKSNASAALQCRGPPGVAINYVRGEEVITAEQYASSVASPGQPAFIDIRIHKHATAFKNSLIADCGSIQLRHSLP